jgi:NAD(P)-dependent dehydrogenase (short-subunit alcohol dehydrogenase family)
MGTASLRDRRILVVGASAGIGRAFGVRAAKAGARVALAARRAERLAEAADEAGGAATIVTDLRDAEACARLAGEAAEAVGPIDLVFVSAGASALALLDDADADAWAVALDTNVIGINLVLRSLRPVLAPDGIVAVCSSESVGRPRPGLVPYAASKAALEESMRGWRVEHPQLRFSCVTVGATVPTEFGSSWDPELLGRMMQLWAERGVADAGLMDTDDVAEVLVGTFAVALAHPGVGVEHLTVRSPAGATTSMDRYDQLDAERALTD